MFHHSRSTHREHIALSSTIVEYKEHVLRPNPSHIYLIVISYEGFLKYPQNSMAVASSQTDGRHVLDNTILLPKNKSKARRTSIYAGRQCNMWAESATHPCATPIQSKKQIHNLFYFCHKYQT